MTTLRLKGKVSQETPFDRVSGRIGEILRKTKEKTEKQQEKKLRLFVWEMLADYANGNSELFEDLVLGCIRLNNHIVVWSPGSGKHQPVERRGSYKDAAPKYQADFKLVVLWLVHRNLDAAEDAFAFLWKHFSLIKMRRHFKDKSLEYGSSLLDGGTLASPICEFILAGIDRHNRGEEDIPLGTCQLCGKFMAIERQGRKMFCSKNCGVKTFYAGRGGAAEYMRELRQIPAYKRRQK